MMLLKELTSTKQRIKNLPQKGRKQKPVSADSETPELEPEQ